MKKSVIAVLALSLVLFSGVASANVIGVFGDQYAIFCEIDASQPYTTAVFHFVALMSDIPRMSAAEFGATGLLGDAANIVTPAWSTDLVIGSLPAGVSLAWTVPLDGPVAYLGAVNVFLMAAYPADQLVSVVASEDGNLVIVDADAAEARDAMGWSSLINCSADCGCDIIATDDNSWSEIKALY